MPFSKMVDGRYEVLPEILPSPQAKLSQPKVLK
jgi:hypothetical protein